MRGWKLPEQESIRTPYEVLQDYADSLASTTKGKLSGKVADSLYYDNIGRPKIIYALHVFLPTLKQTYRLFEVEQLSAEFYPVALKVYYYSRIETFSEIKNADDLTRQLDDLVSSKEVSTLIGHFLRLLEKNKGGNDAINADVIRNC